MALPYIPDIFCNVNATKGTPAKKAAKKATAKKVATKSAKKAMSTKHKDALAQGRTEGRIRLDADGRPTEMQARLAQLRWQAQATDAPVQLALAQIDLAQDTWQWQVQDLWAQGWHIAQASGQGAAYIDRAEATLPEDVRRRITRKRKAGDADAAIDPLAIPEVKAAVNRATFELLVGFQLDERQLAYNATR